MTTCLTTEFYVGEDWSYTATIVDADGDVTTPSSLTFTVTLPGATSSTTYTAGSDAEVTNPSTGVYVFTSSTVLAAVTAGQDTGKIVVEAVNAGKTERSVAYFRAVTP